MTKKKATSLQKTKKAIDKKDENADNEDQKPGFPDIDFKKNLGCG